MKNIVLIRHGQSRGQVAHRKGMSREDLSLIDCFLTRKGVYQAQNLQSDVSLYNFDLVCTSPLTRAIATCVLGMGHITENEMKRSANGIPVTPFVAHPSISEAGTGIPENHGREIKLVKKDLKRRLSSISPSSSICIDHIDFSLMPKSWPLIDDSIQSGKELQLELFLKWLRTERKEQTIAIVCHYNIILWLLDDSIDHVPNCMLIDCILLEDTPRLVLKSDYESGNYFNGDGKKHHR